MPVRYAASGIAVVSALLVATDAFAHHSFAPHFDSSKPVSISGTVTEFEAQNRTATCTSLQWTRTAGHEIRV